VKLFRGNESAKAPGRKMFNAMLKYCKGNEIEDILVESYDRLHRNKEDEVTIDKCVKSGGNIHRVGERIIQSKDQDIEDQTLDEIKFVFSRHERRKISKRVKYGLEQKLKKGEFPCSPPLGYKSISKKDKNLPQQIFQTPDAPKVENLLIEFNKGKLSLMKLEKIAKDLGLCTAYKKVWLDREDIRRLIKNRFYYGEFDYMGKIYTNKTSGFAPIITKKIWEQNQHLLESQRLKKDSQKKTKQESFKFHGLLTCGKCRRAFWGEQFDHKMKYKLKNGDTVKKHYTYPAKYHCTRGTWFTNDGVCIVPEAFVDKKSLRVNMDIPGWLKEGTKVEAKKCDMPWIKESVIEHKILDEIELLKFNQKVWDDVKARVFQNENKEFLEYEIKMLRAEMTRNETMMDTLYGDYQKGIIDGEYCRKKQEQIRVRQQEIKDRLAELEEEREVFDKKIGKAIEILDHVKNFKESYQKADADRRKQILKLMTIKISPIAYKKPIRAKEDNEEYAIEVEIVWNEEFSELMDLGIIEMLDKESKKKPPLLNPSMSFNGEKNSDG